MFQRFCFCVSNDIVNTNTEDLCILGIKQTWVYPNQTEVFPHSQRTAPQQTVWEVHLGGRFKNAYELLNLRALGISLLYKNHIFQCMGKIFCVEFQRVPLKFHSKYLTYTLKDVDFIHRWKFKSSFWNAPLGPQYNIFHLGVTILGF